MAIDSVPNLDYGSFTFEERNGRRYNASVVVVNTLICIVSLALLTSISLIVINLVWAFSSVPTLNEYKNQYIVNEICKLPFKTGRCRGIYIRYYYDTGLNNCSEFIYGGCGGNTNKFISYEACMEKCLEKVYI